MSQSFIKLIRSQETLELLRYPKAFALAALIALRANRKGPNYSPYSLQKGEALIGDYKSCGMTRGVYRWAKIVLKRNQIATFRTTNKGTIARLIGSNIFDINIEPNNHQSNNQTTIKQQPNNHQTTSKNNIKEIKESKRNIANPDSELNRSESGLLFEKKYEPTSQEFEDLRKRIDEIGTI